MTVARWDSSLGIALRDASTSFFTPDSKKGYASPAQFKELKMANSLIQPVISGVRYFLAHTPGLVRYGSRPARDIARARLERSEREPSLAREIASHLRSYEAAAAYPPNRVFLGAIYPDDLRQWEQPWFHTSSPVERWNPHGEIMPEEEFYGLIKLCDDFDLVWLEEGFRKIVRAALGRHPIVGGSDLSRLDEGHLYSEIESQVAPTLGVANGTGSIPLYLRDGRIVGCIRSAHEEDHSLTAEVLLENLACKASATMSLLTLFHPGHLTRSLAEPIRPEINPDVQSKKIDPSSVEYVLNSGEEAVGDRYQRGGGNLAKAVAEMCGCVSATGSDIKGFCCGPMHALVIAAGLVSSRVFRQVAVVGGCSLAKLGMKYRGHLDHDQPILEDVLAGVAVMVSEDDRRSPVFRLDSLGRHTVGAGSSQQAILELLVAEPLQRLQMDFRNIDKYATELHNPEITEPSGSGNVPLLNYRMIGALATLKKEITGAEVPGFVEAHGMPGFSPTQGHIASAVPFLGHAVERMRAGSMERAMFLAKGSLFLGRMTRMSDGLSFVLERNRGR